jgi:hypothetical protein
VQPITYSLILNILALIVTGVLAWLFNQPMLVVVALVLQTHALNKFQESNDYPEEEAEQPMGFTADVK